eukprot:Gb_22043 [translate_table: standard]
MVQIEAHEPFGHCEYSRPELIPGQVQKCGMKVMDKASKQDSDVDFDPSAPYSSSMDNVPLKVLFGVPNAKMRQSPSQEKKAIYIEISSPKDQGDSSDSVRSKLRDSLSCVLVMVGDEQHKKDVIMEKKLQTEAMATEGILIGDCQSLETEQAEFKSVTDKYCGKEEVTKSLKRERQDFEHKPELGEDADSLGCLNRFSHQEPKESEMISDSNISSAEISENCTSKRMRIEQEEMNRDINEQIMQFSELGQIVAVKIEAELFRIYGGVNKKYKEKARSLLFNLKDRNNPELRARVMSGEITPESLCCMTAEQLASKELSQWRIAKAEEFAHMVVLPDSDVDYRRLVKKTHKGEFQVEVEQDDVAPEVAAGAGQLISTSQGKQELAETNEAINVDQVEGVVQNHEYSGIATSSPTPLSSSNSSGQVVEVAAIDTGAAEVVSAEASKERKGLPAIMSLDDYMGSWDDPSNEGAEADAILKEGYRRSANLDEGGIGFSDYPSITGEINTAGYRHSESLSSQMKCLNGVDEWKVGSPVESPESPPYEKLWEGILQLNPSAVETVVAFFKSGEKGPAKDWSKFVEIKGRVRLDAFEKFLQELPLSRSRAVMVIYIRSKDDYSENGLTSMREVADSYKQGERVGYAEPAPGVELYLCPCDMTTLEMLNKYVSCQNFENINEQDGLIGCVVWRRTNLTSSVAPKMPEQYINAKKLALSGHMLDSPTRPGVLESTPYGIDNPKCDTNAGFEKLPVKSRLQTIQSRNDPYVEKTRIEAKKNLETDLPPGFGSWSARTAPCDPRINVPKVHPYDDLIDDVPPGFGPKAAATRNGGNAPKQPTNLDDDDLPEFDYGGVSVTYPPPTSQFPPSSNVQSFLPTQCSGQLSPAQAFTSCNQGYFQPNLPIISPQNQLINHQNAHVPRPPSTPHPSMQIRELIQKFGQSEVVVPFASEMNCVPNAPEVNIAPCIGQQTGATHLQHMPGNVQCLPPPPQVPENKLWSAGDDIPEWHPPYFQTEDTPAPLMPNMGSAPPPSSGIPNFIGNIQPVCPPPPRGPLPPRGSSQIPAQQVPPLLQGRPPPLPPGPRPLTDMVSAFPMMVTERDHGLLNANNSSLFHPSHNFRPALSEPDFMPLDARNRRL